MTTESPDQHLGAKTVTENDQDYNPYQFPQENFLMYQVQYLYSTNTQF